MNITEAELYWITRLDSISSLLVGLIVLAVALHIGYILWLGASTERMVDFPCHKLRRAFIVTGITVFVLMLTNTMLPSTQDMLIIKGIPVLANSEDFQALLTKDLPAYCRKVLEAKVQK